MATVIQAVDGVTGNGNPEVKAFGSNVTIGNHLVVVFGSDSTPPSTPTDTRGNSYQLDASINVSVGVFVYSCKNVSTGANTVSVAGAGIGKAYSLYEVSGLDGTTWFDAATTNNGTSTSPATGNVTAAGAGFIVHGVGWDASTSCNAPGGAWTQHGFESESFAAMTINSQYQANGAGGTFSISQTLGASATWNTVIVAYKNAAGVGGPTVQAIPTMRVPNIMMS